MSAIMNEQCNYSCGPYHGYSGHAEYDSEADLFHGEVVGTRDVVTFQGRTLAQLRKAFQESVDDYLAFCKERGESPERPFSGKFVARITPDVHRALSLAADREGVSLNQLVNQYLSEAVSGGSTRSRASDRSTSRPQAKTSRKTARQPRQSRSA
jgi:predicted HicB family RNase H-like nuclease